MNPLPPDTDPPAEWDVLGLGTIVVDHLVILPGPLEPDVKHEIHDHRLQVGGPVPTALVVLQRWGLATSFVGEWSEDPHGALIDRDLRNESIHVEFAARNADGHTGFAHVWVDTGRASRTIAFRRSAGRWDRFDPRSIPWNAIRLLHLDGWPAGPSVEAAREAKKQGCLVSLDTGSVKDRLDELLPMVDIMNCTRRFLRDYLGSDDPETGAGAVRERGPELVTVTDGSNGAWIASESGVLHQPAYSVDAVDTTGAGDTFTAGILFGALSQWNPAEILRLGCAAAALKCRTAGNRAALPTLAEARALADLA